MYEIRECLRPGCETRFPLPEGAERTRCPRCGAVTTVVAAGATEPAEPGLIPPYGPVLQVLLDNIRSAFNVGSMFRSADGAGVSHIHLLGVTPTPDNPKVAKTSLGAERAIPWSHHPNGLDAAQKIRAAGLRLWALESGSGSAPIFQALPDLNAAPIGLVVGNEVNGVDPEILRLCEKQIYIPMQGVKGSLNVATAFGIAAYCLRYGPNFRVGASADAASGGD